MALRPNSTTAPKAEQSPRLSVTLPLETYASLERNRKEEEVSLAWVVRDATEKYVSDELPLFREGQKMTDSRSFSHTFYEFFAGGGMARAGLGA